MSTLLALQTVVTDAPIQRALLDPAFLLFVLGLAATIGILFYLALRPDDDKPVDRSVEE